MLSNISSEAQQLHAQSFQVSVNLFAADKSQANEHTDWAYWQSGKASQSADTHIFDAFVRSLRTHKIGFSLRY